jgi:hypothetical protein
MTAESHAHDDDGRGDEIVPATPSPAPGDAVLTSACPLCGAVVGPNELRCPRCNMTLAGIGGRPGPFSTRVLWSWALALLAIYLVVLAIVALFPA